MALQYSKSQQGFILFTPSHCGPAQYSEILVLEFRLNQTGILYSMTTKLPVCTQIE